MQREHLATMRAKRNAEKGNVKEAILLHKKEEAKQAKFIDQQNKARYTVQLEQQKRERDLQNRIQK